ncbi:TetR/AcrR family transcriptional regulator [uncultured Winogradskyella sp.]|uniref:TetR/AcrR family transcriptional regulator n=1 Tax=uncultured Winogradskyella sp. TaxID=395353 RepID=UPI0030EE7142
MNKRNSIIEQSLALFFNFGIQHITMDDIANKCGVSKKTIYKYFENKSDLLQAVIKLQVDELKEFLNEMNINSANSLEELHGFFKYVNSISHTISPSFTKELKKYHPDNYIEVFKYKNEIILPFVIKNINRGKHEGLYKSNLNAEEICDSFDNVSKIVFTENFLFDTNKKSIDFLNSLFLYRLVSIKGLEVLNGINK